MSFRVISAAVLSVLMVPLFGHATVVKQSSQVQLNGQNQTVIVDLDFRRFRGTIQVGNESFSLQGGSEQSVDAQLEVKTNGRVTVDKNLQLIFSADDPKALRAMVDNKKEVKCSAQSNAMILIGDNLTGSLVGNCLTLVDQK